MSSTHLAHLLETALFINRDRVLQDEYGARFSGERLLDLAMGYHPPLGVSTIAIDAEHEAATVAKILSCVLRGVAYVPVMPGEALPVASATNRLALGAGRKFDRVVGNIAYLLRTSGSTGEPKFVVQGYEEAGFHANAYADSLGLNSEDKIALLASLTTDASLMDMFGGLIRGAMVCMFDPRRKKWQGLARWVAEQRITVLHMTPTLLRLAFGGERTRGLDLSSVRCVVLGGEPATLDDFETFLQAFPRRCDFINGYGPSECTTALQCRGNVRALANSGRLPLGHPLPGCKVRVAENGELWLASPGLFWGYHGRDDLTDACFVKDGPITWYRTGDLVDVVEELLYYRERLDGRKKVNGLFVPGELGRTMKAGLDAS